MAYVRNSTSIYGGDDKDYEGRSAENKLFANEKGIADSKALLDSYGELLKRMQDVNEQTLEVSKVVGDSYKGTLDKLIESQTAVAKAKGARDATKQAYQDAIKNEKDEGKKKSLEKQQKKEELKANEEFYKQIADAVKEGSMSKEEAKKAKAEYYGSSQAAAAVDFTKTLDKVTSGLSAFSDKLKGTIESIGNFKTAWDTRLFGSDRDHTSIADLVKNSIGISPYIKQQAVMDKLNNAIDQGINYNVEQRAFLDVLSDSVATTFNAFDATIKNIIRVQQADSTAYRLGMEASLNEYLNRMFESTEYLSDVSDSVTSNLYEATSLLSASQAIDYEYQIQKWLGALYSVGMSNSAISSISQSLGQLLSGNVSGTDSGTGKLLVMAAANAGLDYSKLLTDSLDSSEINTLLASMVSYLQEIANDNKVVQTQMAGVFGLQTSDIQAAKNLKGYVDTLMSESENYNSGTALSNLNRMMNSIGSRMSTASKLTNAKENFEYTLAEGIASNPALYSIFTIGDLLKQYTGGISIPAISVMGNMVDLETTVADLLKVGALSGSMLSGIGALFSGISQIGNFGQVYDAFAKESYSTVRLGGGLGIGSELNDMSQLSVNYKGNQSSDDYTNANDAMVSDQKNSVQAKYNEDEDESEKDIKLKDLDNTNTQILMLLTDLVNGSKTIYTKSTTSYGTADSNSNLGGV